MEESHAGEIFAVVDRERARLSEWLPWVAATTEPEHTRQFIRRALDQFASNEGFHAGIWCAGRYCGAAGFHRIDWVNSKVEIGYWIASEFQGRGIIHGSCRAIILHAFAEWKLNRVEIRCATGNARSNAVAAKLGFQLEGTLRDGQLLNGRFWDLRVYGMLAREWPGSAASSSA